MLEIRKILVAIDFSEWSSRSVNYASLMARRFGADLDLVHVIMPATLSSPGIPLITPSLLGLDESYEVKGRADLEHQADELRAHGLKVRPFLVVGDPLEEILRAARDGQADLLVMGTHGRTGLTHLLLGSVAENLLRRSPCPVLCVRKS